MRAEVYTSMIFAGFPFDSQVSIFQREKKQEKRRRRKKCRIESFCTRTLSFALSLARARSLVRSHFFFTSSSSFLFPHQTLDLHLSMTASPYPNNASLAVKSSATGIKLYTQGFGDDLSSWRVTDLHVFVVEELWTKQFDDPGGLRNLVQPSDRADPAPLVPTPGDAAARAALERDNSRVLRLTVSIFVSRLSLYFALQSILPVALCTLLSLTCFFLGASRVATRLELTFSLFLALAAIQFVIGEGLPKTSAVLPSQVLVLFSYSFLFAVAAESLVVYHVERFPDLRVEWRRRAAAKEAASRELSHAVSSSGRRLVKSISSLGRRGKMMNSSSASSVASAAAANDAARRHSVKEVATATAAATGCSPFSLSPGVAATATATATATAPASSSPLASTLRELRPLRSIRFSSDVELGTAAASSSSKEMRRDDGDDDDDQEQEKRAGGPNAAFAAPGDHDCGKHKQRGILCTRNRRGGGAGAEGGGDDDDEVPGTRDRTRGRVATLSVAERDRYAFAAWWIDRASFWLLLSGYALAAVLIFSLSSALAPGDCAQFAQRSLVDECRLARRAAEARRP
jgi:hypothetical protein